jgi:hypothetical protein
LGFTSIKLSSISPLFGLIRELLKEIYYLVGILGSLFLSLPFIFYRVFTRGLGSRKGARGSGSGSILSNISRGSSSIGGDFSKGSASSYRGSSYSSVSIGRNLVKGRKVNLSISFRPTIIGGEEKVEVSNSIRVAPPSLFIILFFLVEAGIPYIETLGVTYTGVG